MTPREIIAELAQEYEILLNLTKFELSDAGNAERPPWERLIERGDAVLSAYKALAEKDTDHG